MTLKDIQTKLYEKLKVSGWGDKLKMFLLSDEFAQILSELYTNSNTGKRFTPVLKDMFSAFEKCPYNKLKVVMIASNPYDQLNIADGMAFSCSNSKKPEAPLRIIYRELENTVYPDGYTWDPDLTRWAEQGILLLNPALTTQVENETNHQELWQPFMIALLDMLGAYNPGLIYVFMGNTAKEWHKSVKTNNYKFFTTHPASAVYHKDGEWNSGNLFNQINVVLTKNNGEEIIW